MPKIQQSAIKEIATKIANGNTCYLHRYTAKIITIDHSVDNEKLMAAQKKTQEDIERKKEDYIKINKLSTENHLVIMKDFLEELRDRSVRKQLANALNRKNPIRNFKQTIESDMELTLHWGNYSAKEYHRWVSNVIIDAYNY